MTLTECKTVYSALNKQIHKDRYRYEPEIISDLYIEKPVEERFFYVRLHANGYRLSRLEDLMGIADAVIDGVMFEVQAKDNKPIFDIY